MAQKLVIVSSTLCTNGKRAQISKFQLDSQKMIQDLFDACITIDLMDVESDVLNEVRRGFLFAIDGVGLYELGSSH
jgi:hypothetical protein